MSQPHIFYFQNLRWQSVVFNFMFLGISLIDFVNLQYLCELKATKSLSNMIDKLKNIFQRTKKSTGNFVGQRATMKACMMGPRAVGKTTIMTSIFHNTSESIAQTNLKFVADADTLARMNTCRNEINSIFEEGKSVVDRPSAGISSTSSVNVFHYEFGLKGKATAVDLEIKDFPGEFINGGLHTEEVDQFIAESNAILIAIDTPHLMEESSFFNEAKNMSGVISEYFKKNVNVEDEKLILFVPLKCEKYYYEHRMAEVNLKIKEVYKELIIFLQDKEQIVSAITPILTIGGIEFDNFSRNEKGCVVTNPNGLPDETYYKFYKVNPKLKPMYCVQPLYYILSYVTAQYADNQNKGNVFKRFVSNLFNLFSSDVDLYAEMKKLGKFKLTDRQGYEILTGAELIDVK